ncbi:Type 4 fimbrial biogenesis protein pilO [Alcanivorax hongdengensis A-11-3]|uniref:Type 4 fimbrial biogenesis protein pilO n=1 Tax=Alcanivorax hongdengensis A-11-3 TaxID=1177179 RepID=L0WGF9_9GAMM|nr:type 4a pilus biogenesis protein PilO [Alcanivorax hongdengensis]EKF76111.1 Type 4 fimbrial biogenesis protein pilO [Alcanivorax hongdengensis A-11-3]
MKASELKNLDLRELMDELNSLDFENVGGWPTPVKIGAAVLVLVLVVVLGYFLSISDAKDRLASEQREEQSLLKSFESKAFEAHNLDQYRAQLAEMEQTFGTLLQQLPKDTEVPGLLEDITHTGLGSGLEFETIELKNEAKKEFYTELPIDIKVVGDYHGFGSFVSGVAALPRIVTLHDFHIGYKERQKKGLIRDPSNLEMEITAKTYRYASGNDDKKDNKKSGGRK